MKQLVGCILVFLICAVALGADRTMAEAWAVNGTELANKGKIDEAKSMFFKALANDEECVSALFELGKIYETEGQTALAGHFFSQAIREYGKMPKPPAQKAEAERHLQKLDPFAIKYLQYLADYTQELNTITKKAKDSLTLAEACDHADALQLRTALPADKGPKFARIADTKPDPDNPDKPAPLAPEIEKALKAQGWTSITGGWKKIDNNVYEVSDGTLTLDKTNGAMQVVVRKSNGGSVRIMVRNTEANNAAGSASGYGVVVQDASFELYVPYNNGSGIKYYPYKDRDVALSEANARNLFVMQVNDNILEYYVNGARVKSTSYKINKDGPFVIEVKGTMTIENPVARGQ